LPGLNVYYLETNSEPKLDSAAGIINSESSTTNIITRKTCTYITNMENSMLHTSNTAHTSHTYIRIKSMQY